MTFEFQNSGTFISKLFQKENELYQIFLIFQDCNFNFTSSLLQFSHRLFLSKVSQ